MRDAVRREIALDTAREELPPERRDRDADDPAARLASARAPLRRRRRARLRQPLRLRARHVPQRARAARRAAAGRTSTCRSSSRTSRRGSGREAFALAEDELGLPHGSIRCTVLIETILAAFEMDEILYELRDYGCALNAGRWDYIFSCIKKFRARELGAARPGAGDDGRAVHARVHASCSCARATGAARTRSAAWPRSSRRGATRRSTRSRSRRCARTRSASRGDGLRRHVGRASRSRAGRDRRASTPCSATGRTSSSGCATTSSRTRRRCSRSRRRPGRDHRDGPAHERLASASATSTRGCTASAPRRSTT